MKQLVVSIAAVVSLVSPVVAHADKNFRSGKGATWDCKHDPTVNIIHGNGVYTLKGSCTTVNVTGGNNKLTVASSDALNINGANNKVTIDAVDAININGADNTVTYKAAIHGDAPTVGQVGSNNVVSGKAAAGGGKPGDAGGKPGPADKAAAAGAHDCAKAPTAEINEGDGNYRFVGPCTKIAINGGDNTVSIESVQTISINGSTNTVTIGSADQISVMGSDNKVSYRKAISGPKPRVGSLGDRNQVSQVK
jgi:Protein of unknown function (DUF3060)